MNTTSNSLYQITDVGDFHVSSKQVRDFSTSGKFLLQTVPLLPGPTYTLLNVFSKIMFKVIVSHS
jgi:hypothetical protein